MTRPRRNLEFTGVSAKQLAGIEPVSPAWEASILPMNYSCTSEKYYTITLTKIPVKKFVSLFPVG